MARKLIRLLLLDANVVLELHRLQLWKPVTGHCEVILASTVVQESHFYEDDNGERIDFDLSEDIAAGTITEVSVDLATIAAFRGRFKPTFLERLDPGEMESLAYLVEIDHSCLISSADRIVWRTLGALDLREQGISLERILKTVGLQQQVGDQFTEAFRNDWTARGFTEAFQGQALR